MLGTGVHVPLLIGVLLAATVQHGWLWLGRRRDALAGWAAAASAGGIVHLVGEYLERAGPGLGEVVLGGRIRWTGALALMPVLVALGHALAGRPVPRRGLAAMAAIGAALMGLVWSSDLLATAEVGARTDLFGTTGTVTRPGPLALAMVPYVLFVVAWFWHSLTRRPSGLDRGERWLLGLSFGACTVLAVNEVLHAARLVTTVRLFDWAFVIVSGVLTRVLVRRHQRLEDRLEAEVESRTAGLERRALELDSLVRAGQAVTAGLDFGATLDRIVAEARRISGSPHVKIMLVDREAGLIRPAAAAGQVSAEALGLDEGYAGRVVASGEILYAGDTQTDPRNPWRERHRALGLCTYLGLPIRTGGEVLGVLSINTEAPRSYQPDELASLAAFAAQAGVAIDNARLHGAARRREQRLAQLVAMASSLTAETDVDDLLRQVAERTLEAVGPGVVNLWLVAGEGDELVLRAQAGLVAEAPTVSRLPAGQGLMGRVVRTGRRVAVRDGAAEPDTVNAEWFRTHGMAGFAGVPMRVGGRAVGGLSLTLRERRRPDEETVLVLQAFADHAAAAVERARVHQRVDTHARRLAAMVAVARRLSGEMDRARLLGGVAAAAAEVFGGEAGFRVVEGEWLVRAGATPGALEAMVSERLRLGESISGRVAATGQPLMTTDTGRDPRVMPAHRHGKEDRVGSLLCVPVKAGDRVLGTLHVFRPRGHRFDGDELALAASLAAQAAIALENARLYATTEHQARELTRRLTRLDALTRLSRLISGSLEPETVLREIARAAAELMEVPFASFWTVDETGETLTLAAVSDPAVGEDYGQTTLRFGESLVGRVAARRRPVAVADVAAEPGVAQAGWWARHGFTAFYGHPVVYEGALVAVLAVVGRRPLGFEAEDRALVDSLAVQAAVAIRNARAYEAEREARREAELALAQVKELQGLLPICAYCKKVRDEQNYWQAIERYIGERSRATFSHGICPDCRARLFGPSAA